MESIMPSQPSSVPVPGSERSPVPQAQAVGPATRDERLESYGSASAPRISPAACCVGDDGAATSERTPVS